MKILLASSEVHPYSKTGGLADMVGALAKALARQGNHVGLVTPLYLGVRERFPDICSADLPIDVPLGLERVRGEVWKLSTEPRLTLYFVDQPHFYQRTGLYQKDGLDYPDNAERFVFFSKAVAHLACHLPWKPELLHIHDWQAGLAALLVQHQRKLPGWSNVPRVCITVHNLAYQGVFPVSLYPLTNLPWDYFVPSGVEFYGGYSCLKAGINFADNITTVSPRYAAEITTLEFGCGLEGLLQERRPLLHGILNGVDYSEWNTTNNPYLLSAYSPEDLKPKEANKLALQRELGLPERPNIPLFGNIGRLVDQKGVDIMLEALQDQINNDIQFVLLGSGAVNYQVAFQNLARRYPEKVAVRIGFDHGLSHRIEAGCDFFVMPSRFEPCGLNQMYSLRYGTIPIVRAVGGLDDTVTDIRENPEHPNGIKFHEYAGAAMSKAMHKALALYAVPELFRTYRLNGMRADFSWDRTARQYLDVYKQAITSHHHIV